MTGGGRAGGARARGRAAEAAAAAWLEGQGYAVLARNHTTRRGEVDLVCRDGEAVVFVEVRSRSRIDYGTLAASVGAFKARRVIAAARDWAVRNGGLSQAMRFDVVAVDLSGATPRFTLFRNAFDDEGQPM